MIEKSLKNIFYPRKMSLKFRCSMFSKVNLSKLPIGDTPLHLAARRKDPTLCKVREIYWLKTVFGTGGSVL
jgi:hypothetical protein